MGRLRPPTASFRQGQQERRFESTGLSGDSARPGIPAQLEPSRGGAVTGGEVPETLRWRREVEELRTRLVDLQSRLEASQRIQDWLHSALGSERQSRFLLEASLPAAPSDPAALIRDALCATTPPGATVLVTSKGDPELFRIAGWRLWHFLRHADGQYAGYHPADSGAAIQHLLSLMGQGAQFLLLPRAAFWWLEYYVGFRDHLDQRHARVWRDEHCAIYRLLAEGLGDTLLPPELASEDLSSQGRTGSGNAASNRSSPVVGCSRSSDRHDVVCFPIIEWGFRFQRPQQLMTQFAAAGHRVFYLSQEFRASGGQYQVRELGRNLYEIRLRGPKINAYRSILDNQSREILFASLDSVRRDQEIGSTVAIVQLPFWWPLAKRASSSFGWPVIYDCMDHYGGFSTNHPLMLEHERELLAQADLVMVSSALLETHARRHSSHVLLVRNGCDYDHFSKIKPKPVGARPVIGYYGAIADWFDSSLVASLAEARPDWDFVLVGSTFSADIRRLSQLPNVSLPGESSYGEIPDWLARFDVAILPFKRNALTEATNPVKAYEILAAGKPLVSVPLPEMLSLFPLVRLASTPDEFERAIELELIKRSAALESRRRAFARENTWHRRFGALGPELERVLGKPRIAPRVGAVPNGRMSEENEGRTS